MAATPPCAAQPHLRIPMRKKLKLAAALSATLAFFVLLFAAAAGAGVAVLRDNQAAIEALGRGNIERASDLGDTTSWLFQARAVLADAKTYMEGGLEEQRDAALAQAATLLEQARASQERLRANPEMAAQGASLYDEVLAGYDALAVQALAPLHAALKGWNGIEANRLAERVLPQAAERYIEAVDAFQGYAREQGRAAVADAARVLERMVLGAAALLALVAVLAVVIRLGFRRAMLRPLTEAGRHFDRIADGDLTAAIAARGDNEIGVLYSAMRRMQGGLTRAVESVRHGVEEIHTGSGEIAAGGVEMSGRTARQAGALQEAAASMAELAGTSRQAAGATELARQGGTAVAQVVASMRDIASGAQRIAEIVGLVDSLAFQTNVLALNAAVEAARAGPQGRGFAVVAGEVRSLAQRSAQAAREIKGLIDDSSARVASGVQQVNLAGATMGEIVQSIDRVTQLVAGISEASATQAAGIASVNLAVADAERATQENAAMAEQTAAAAASLEAQAQALRQAVAVFRLAGAAPRSGGAGGQLVALDHQRQVAVLDLLLDAGGGRGEVLRANVAA
ncbi:methyl-accepting chemotaxis protein [Bordetella bronchiseptica MO211]|nr:methyl-accepting chemotaxis protein [Bordetella bronchiseptica MO211]